MRILKIKFAALIFCSACAILQAQNINPDARKWGENPETFLSQTEVLALENIVLTQESNLTKVQAIYTAIEAGEVVSITSHLDSEVSWNRHSQFLFSDGNPHLGSDALLEATFDKIGEGWSNWELYEVIYEKRFENIITVSGRYKATHEEQITDAAFLHVWTWKNGKIVEFQHYEPVQAVAKR